MKEDLSYDTELVLQQTVAEVQQQILNLEFPASRKLHRPDPVRAFQLQSGAGPKQSPAF
jgi:hypothetical protein